MYSAGNHYGWGLKLKVIDSGKGGCLNYFCFVMAKGECLDERLLQRMFVTRSQSEDNDDRTMSDSDDENFVLGINVD